MDAPPNCAPGTSSLGGATAVNGNGDGTAAVSDLGSRELLQAIIGTTPECMKIVARDGTVLRINPAGVRMVEAESAAEVEGQSIFDIIAPGDRATWQANHERVCDGERLSWSFDIIGRRGRRRHMESHAAPLRLPDGATAQLAITHDVTEQRQYEDRLRDGEERFRSLLEALPAAVYTTDAEGRITFFNSAAVRLAGRTPVLGSDEWCVTWRLYGPDGTPMPHDQCPMAIALKENRPVLGLEAIAERPDGTRIPFMPYPMPLRDASGTLIGAVNMLVDITERKRGEEDLRRLSEQLEERVKERTKELADALARLQQSESRFRLLVEGASDYAMCMLDPDGLVSNWNAGGERMKGYTSADIIGKHFSTFYTEEDRRAGAPDRALATARSTGRFESEGWRMRKDGSRFWANAVIDAIHDEHGDLVGFAKVTRDMTERRKLEEQLRHAQKMEALGQLTGGIAHDFNNLLTVVVGHADFITTCAVKEEVRRHAEAAMRAATRGANLTRQLLAFSRKQRLEPVATSLNELVRGMSEMLPRTLGGTIRIELALGEGLWPALIDANQIENAILNLAINARDAMAEGGTLTIETANLRVGELRRAGGLEAGDYVLVSVTDTGTGMTDEVKAKAFDPFFTTKAIGRGSGLGLSQVYGIARQSGGTAEIDSTLGRGTTVRLYLPRAAQSAEGASASAALRLEATAGAGTRVLVADDDEDVRALVVEALNAAGFDAAGVTSGREAMDALRRSRFELLVVDFAMAEMDGAECARLAHAEWPTLPILLITGHADIADVPALRNLSKDAVLRKPFALADLTAKALAVLDAYAPANVVPLHRERA